MPPEKYDKLKQNIVVDITNKQNRDALKGQASDRIPVTIKLENGSTVKGFYTKDTDSDYTKKYYALLDSIINELETNGAGRCNNTIELFKEIKNKIKPEVLSNSIDSNARTFNKEILEVTEVLLANNQVTFRILQDFKEYGFDTNKFDLALNEPLFRSSMNQLITKGVMMAPLTYTVNDLGGIEKDKIANRRNNAMYDVSKLLGSDDLICQSLNMTTIDNGTRTNGTFMINANGYYRDTIKPVFNGSNKLNLGYSANAKRDLSKLQVLDFLCANTDRHSGNFFFTTKLVNNHIEIDRIQGIDNDMSFGKLKGNGNGTTKYMSNIDDIKFIDKSQADAIRNMKPIEFEAKMRLAGLSRDEIEAGLNRLNQLKSKIKSGKDLQILDGDNAWDAMNPREAVSKDNIWYNVKDIFSIYERNANRYLISHETAKDLITTLDDYKNPKPSNDVPELSESKNSSAKEHLLRQIDVFKELKADFDKTNPEKRSPEFGKMYDGLKNFITTLEEYSTKGDDLTDIEYNKLSDKYGDLMKDTAFYIQEKGHPFTDNGKERVHIAKNMLVQIDYGRHMALEETTMAFNRRMEKAYEDFGKDYKAIIDIDKSVNTFNKEIDKTTIKETIKSINELSNAKLDDQKLQIACGEVMKKLVSKIDQKALDENDKTLIDQTIDSYNNTKEALKPKENKVKKEEIKETEPIKINELI